MNKLLAGESIPILELMRSIDISRLGLIKQTGGTAGVRDFNLLESAIETPFQAFDGVELYPTIQAKGARLGYGLIKNHCMLDGNKHLGTHAII